MKAEDIIQETARFVQTRLKDAESGHDWWHIQRVWSNTKLILQTEEADVLVCELTALLHDIADSKFHDGDETIGPRIAGEFLQTVGLDVERIEQVQAIILNMSFKASLGERSFHSKELEIVQDADRLDAIGAIGIARAFTYGGFKNREIYNPGIPVEQHLTKEAYKNTTAPTKYVYAILCCFKANILHKLWVFRIRNNDISLFERFCYLLCCTYFVYFSSYFHINTIKL